MALTIRADGSSDRELSGASGFPRHWVYDHSGRLVAKSGLTELAEWCRTAFGTHSPWGDEDSPMFTTMAETALERQPSGTIMGGRSKPRVTRRRPGAVVGERAVLEGSGRTATLPAVTAAKVARAARYQIDRDALAEPAAGHRRQES